MSVQTVTGIEVKINVTLRDIQSLLISAMEGGSNYWLESYEKEVKITPEELQAALQSLDVDEDMRTTFNRYSLPFIPGCALIFTCPDEPIPGKGELYRLDLEAIKRGMEIMANSPQAFHFADIVRENADATTGDVWLQFCLFGELIFG